MPVGTPDMGTSVFTVSGMTEFCTKFLTSLFSDLPDFRFVCREKPNTTFGLSGLWMNRSCIFQSILGIF